MRGASNAFEEIDSFTDNAIQDWYNENSNAVLTDTGDCCSSQNGESIGHFTQVVTDRAVQIGCAIVTYTSGVFKQTQMTCNYAYGGSPAYKKGKTASGCTTGINPNFPALCSVKEPIKA